MPSYRVAPPPSSLSYMSGSFMMHWTLSIFLVVGIQPTHQCLGTFHNPLNWLFFSHVPHQPAALVWDRAFAVLARLILDSWTNSDPSVSAPQVAGVAGAYHHSQLLWAHYCNTLYFSFSVICITSLACVRLSDQAMSGRQKLSYSHFCL